MKIFIMVAQGALLGFALGDLSTTNPRLFWTAIILNPIPTTVYAFLDTGSKNGN